MQADQYGFIAQRYQFLHNTYYNLQSKITCFVNQLVSCLSDASGDYPDRYHGL